MDFKKLRNIRVPSSLLVRRNLADRAKASSVRATAKQANELSKPVVPAEVVAEAEPIVETVKQLPAPRPKTPLGSPTPRPVVAAVEPIATLAAVLPPVVVAEPEPKPDPKPVPAARPASAPVVPKAKKVRSFQRRLRFRRILSRKLLLFVWIVLAIGAAQVTLFMRSKVGVYVDAAAFASLTWLALRIEAVRQLIISVAIIPLAMLVSLCLPAATVFARTADLSVLFLVLGLTYRYLFALDYPVDGTRLRMTRHGYLFAIPLMVVFGQVLGLIGFGLLHHQYDFRDNTLPLVALGSVVFAIAEEVLFRGLIQQRAMLYFGPKSAAVLSAVLYTAVMFGHRGGVLSPIFGLVLGVSLAIVYYRKQNLLLTITINAATKLTYVGLVAIFVLRH